MTAPTYLLTIYCKLFNDTNVKKGNLLFLSIKPLLTLWALCLTGEELQRRARHLNLTRDQ